MPIHYILANLLARDEDAVGVLFLDDSGETVDLACSDFTPYQMRVVGAYIGIYLKHLSKISREHGLGSVVRVHVEQDEVHVHAQALPEGYYLVMLQRSPGMVARARRVLEQAVDELVHEFFGDVA